MADPNKVFIKNINAKDTNFLLYFLLIVAAAGSLFLAWNDVTAGTIYTLMFGAVISFLFLTLFFIKDDNTLKPISNYIKIPFSTKMSLSVFFYLAGLAVPVIIKLLLSIITVNWSVVDFSIPLFGANINHIQSFSAAQIQASMAWKIFIIMFTAGTTETWTFNFGTVLFGVVIGYFILQLINDGKDLSFVSKKWFVVGVAFLVSIIGFVVAHTLNNTYVGVMFVVAGIFLLVSNVSIYLFGVFLTFWMGYHQSNNLLWLVDENGLGAVAQGFLSWFGLLFLGFLILLIYYLLRDEKKALKEVIAWVRS